MPTGIIPNTDIELNLLSGAHWSRTTIADGKWLNSNTIQPLFNNDCILASAIHDTSADLYNRLSDASGELQGEIDVINAGSDVIDVLGSYQDLMNYQSWTTDRDVIKILNDETHSGEQTYYRYSGESEYSGTFDPDPSRWNFVGELAPYYNKTEIDGKINVINSTINNVSSTLHTEITNTSAILHQEILTSAAKVHNELVTTSGNIINVISNVSGDIIDYVDNTSAFLQDEIDFVSGEVVDSSANLYRIIQETSGKTEVSGGIYVEVKKTTKPDGMVSYSADLYDDKIVDLETSGKHITMVDTANKTTIVSDATQVMYAPAGTYAPIDLFIDPYTYPRMNTSGYTVSGDSFSGYIPPMPPTENGRIEKFVLGRDSDEQGWIYSDKIILRLERSHFRVNGIEFKYSAASGSEPENVDVNLFDGMDRTYTSNYGRLIPPIESTTNKNVYVNGNGRVVFNEPSISYRTNGVSPGSYETIHDVHFYGYYGEEYDTRWSSPIDRSVYGTAVYGISADSGFSRGGNPYFVLPGNNNDVGEGVTRTSYNGTETYENHVQSFTQNGKIYGWSKKIPTLFEFSNQNGGSNGYRVNRYYELPKNEAGKYPKFIHGSGMFKVSASNGELHIIPSSGIKTDQGVERAYSIDYRQNYNISGFVQNEWNQVSFDFSRSPNWESADEVVNPPTDYDSDLRYIAIKGNDNSTSNITVENIRFLCWY